MKWAELPWWQSIHVYTCVRVYVFGVWTQDEKLPIGNQIESVSPVYAYQRRLKGKKIHLPTKTPTSLVHSTSRWCPVMRWFRQPMRYLTTNFSVSHSPTLKNKFALAHRLTANSLHSVLWLQQFPRLSSMGLLALHLHVLCMLGLSHVENVL